MLSGKNRVNHGSRKDLIKFLCSLEIHFRFHFLSTAVKIDRELLIKKRLKNSSCQTTTEWKTFVFRVFLVVFPRIWTECWEVLHISPYSVRMQENEDQKNFEYWHFSRSARINWQKVNLPCSDEWWSSSYCFNR